jgi:hypothetical protein
VRRLAASLAFAGLAVAGFGAAGTFGLTGDGGRPADVLTPPDPPDAAMLPPGVEEAPAVLLVWTAGTLPAGLADDMTAAGIGPVTTVRADLIDLAATTDAGGTAVDQAPPGMAFPLDAVAYDPATFPDFALPADQSALAALQPGEAVLGRTSASFRRLGPGGTLELAGGVRLRVAAVVDDTSIGGAEVAVPQSAGPPAPAAARYLLIRHRQPRSQVEDTVRHLLPAGTAVRFRAPGETPFLRHGDAVLPQALIKERFGEFAYRPTGDGTRNVIQDPLWENENIVTTTVPVLGRVRCHRSLVPALTGALRDLEAAGLAGLLPPAGFAGCWNPRLVEPGGAVSRHAWGAAVDFNSPKNPTGLASVQDDRLVETMERWGFTWGGRWLVPDPAHFEYLKPPDR